MTTTFKVGKGTNAAIEISRQTYVTIYDVKGNVVFSDKSNTGQVNPLLVPGEYVIETDGTVGSIKSKSSKTGGQDLD